MGEGILDSVVKKTRPEFDNTRLFGLPITELSRDELMAGLVIVGKQVIAERESHANSVEFMKHCLEVRHA